MRTSKKEIEREKKKKKKKTSKREREREEKRATRMKYIMWMKAYLF